MVELSNLEIDQVDGGTYNTTVAAGVGAVVGAAVGFLFGGPVGAVVGGIEGAVAGAGLEIASRR